jgi:4-amino-4-deoxy-L-arabinose transferase-like glycosyltransferase
MAGQPSLTSEGPAAVWRSPGRILLIVCLLAAIPRLYFATMHPLNYDEYWHVFVARQDTREALAVEWRSTAHPPLYYWLLKLSLLLGSNRLVYRLVSLVAGVAAVFVVGQIVRRLSRNPVVPYLAALTCALALPAVITSFEVRSYMWSTFCMLASFWFYLSMLDTPSRWRIFSFSGLCCLALASNYAAVFFLLACLGCLVYLSVMHWAAEGRFPALVRERPASLAVGLLLPVATIFGLYWEHARGMARGQRQLLHLPAFYYRPETGESILAYLIRAVHQEINIFLPFPLREAAAIPVFVVTVIVLTLAVIYLARQSAELSRRVPYVLVLMISGGLLAASVRGVYPFGGLLRQQFVLFPFLVVAGFSLIDEAMSRWDRWKTPLGALALTAGCLSGLWHIRAVPAQGAGVCIREMNVYQKAFPNPQVVYTDHVGLIVLFAHHDQWQWRAGPRGWRDGRLDRYEAVKDGQSLVVLRDRRAIDLGEERMYRDLAWSLRTLGLKSGVVFRLKYLKASYGRSGRGGGRVHAPGYPCGTEGSPPSNEAERRDRVTALAAAQHLDAGRLIFDGSHFFGAFEGRP